MPGDTAAGFARNLPEMWQPVAIRVRPDRVVTHHYRKGFPVPP